VISQQVKYKAVLTTGTPYENSEAITRITADTSKQELTFFNNNRYIFRPATIIC